MRKLFIITIVIAAAAACFARGANVARAAGLAVTPAVIDDHGIPDDMMNYTLTVKNTDNRVENVFASVYNLTADGKQNFIATVDASKSTSLANWLSVSRAAMLFQPGETKTIPVELQINPYATAGTYHAVIAFVEGNTRDEAETHLNGAPQVLVNLDVASNAKEELALQNFSAVKMFSSAFPADFTYTIENTGDVTSTPSGLVILYDRLGHEIGSTNANPGGVAIAPGESHSFQAEWGSGTGFGQYKAMLDLTYGANGAKLQDVAMVWVLPWQKLLLIFSISLVFIVVLAISLHGHYAKRHHRRMAVIRTLVEKHKQLLANQGHAPAPPPVRNTLDLRRRPEPAEPPKPPHHIQRFS